MRQGDIPGVGDHLAVLDDCQMRLAVVEVDRSSHDSEFLSTANYFSRSNRCTAPMPPNASFLPSGENATTPWWPCGAISVRGAALPDRSTSVTRGCGKYVESRSS